MESLLVAAMESSLSELDWFHPDLSRADAETWLMGRDRGSFLVRRRTDADNDGTDLQPSQPCSLTLSYVDDDGESRHRTLFARPPVGGTGALQWSLDPVAANESTGHPSCSQLLKSLKFIVYGNGVNAVSSFASSHGSEKKKKKKKSDQLQQSKVSKKKAASSKKKKTPVDVPKTGGGSAVTGDDEKPSKKSKKSKMTTAAAGDDDYGRVIVEPLLTSSSGKKKRGRSKKPSTRSLPVDSPEEVPLSSITSMATAEASVDVEKFLASSPPKRLPPALPSDEGAVDVVPAATRERQAATNLSTISSRVPSADTTGSSDSRDKQQRHQRTKSGKSSPSTSSKRDRSFRSGRSARSQHEDQPSAGTKLTKNKSSRSTKKASETSRRNEEKSASAPVGAKVTPFVPVVVERKPSFTPATLTPVATVGSRDSAEPTAAINSIQEQPLSKSHSPPFLPAPPAAVSVAPPPRKPPRPTASGDALGLAEHGPPPEKQPPTVDEVRLVLNFLPRFRPMRDILLQQPASATAPADEPKPWWMGAGAGPSPGSGGSRLTEKKQILQVFHGLAPWEPTAGSYTKLAAPPTASARQVCAAICRRHGFARLHPLFQLSICAPNSAPRLLTDDDRPVALTAVWAERGNQEQRAIVLCFRGDLAPELQQLCRRPPCQRCNKGHQACKMTMGGGKKGSSALMLCVKCADECRADAALALGTAGPCQRCSAAPSKHRVSGVGGKVGFMLCCDLCAIPARREAAKKAEFRSARPPVCQQCTKRPPKARVTLGRAATGDQVLWLCPQCIDELRAQFRAQQAGFQKPVKPRRPGQSVGDAGTGTGDDDNHSDSSSVSSYLSSDDVDDMMVGADDAASFRAFLLAQKTAVAPLPPRIALTEQEEDQLAEQAAGPITAEQIADKLPAPDPVADAERGGPTMARLDARQMTDSEIVEQLQQKRRLEAIARKWKDEETEKMKPPAKPPRPGSVILSPSIPLRPDELNEIGTTKESVIVEMHASDNPKLLADDDEKSIENLMVSRKEEAQSTENLMVSRKEEVQPSETIGVFRSCFKCDELLVEPFKFCLECGANQSERPPTPIPTPEPELPTCVECKELLEEPFKFCVNCGFKQPSISFTINDSQRQSQKSSSMDPIAVVAAPIPKKPDVGALAAPTKNEVTENKLKSVSKTRKQHSADHLFSSDTESVEALKQLSSLLDGVVDPEVPPLPVRRAPKPVVPAVPVSIAASAPDPVSNAASLSVSDLDFLDSLMVGSPSTALAGRDKVRNSATSSKQTATEYADLDDVEKAMSAATAAAAATSSASALIVDNDLALRRELAEQNKSLRVVLKSAHHRSESPSMTGLCLNCQTPNSPSAKFCQACGTKIDTGPKKPPPRRPNSKRRSAQETGAEPSPKPSDVFAAAFGDKAQQGLDPFAESHPLVPLSFEEIPSGPNQFSGTAVSFDDFDEIMAGVEDISKLLDEELQAALK